MTSPSDSTNAKEQDKYVFRFPDGMRDAIKILAKANNRSLNAEIVARLQQTLDEATPQLQGVDLERLATLIVEKLGTLTAVREQLKGDKAEESR